MDMMLCVGVSESREDGGGREAEMKMAVAGSLPPPKDGQTSVATTPLHDPQLIVADRRINEKRFRIRLCVTESRISMKWREEKSIVMKLELERASEMHQHQHQITLRIAMTMIDDQCKVQVGSPSTSINYY